MTGIPLTRLSSMGFCAGMAWATIYTTRHVHAATLSSGPTHAFFDVSSVESICSARLVSERGIGLRHCIVYGYVRFGVNIIGGRR